MWLHCKNHKLFRFTENIFRHFDTQKRFSVITELDYKQAITSLLFLDCVVRFANTKNGFLFPRIFMSTKPEDDKKSGNKFSS